MSHAPPVGLIGVAPRRAAALRAAGLDTLAGDAALAGRCDVVIVEGPEAERAVRIRSVIARGAHAFAAWPPAADADGARALAAVAEEAGVEVGVARPLPIGALLASRPAGWRARIVSLSLGGGAASLPGALDLCASLVGSRTLAGLEAEAVGDAMALALRFRSGALATVTLGATDADAVSLSAVGAGGTVEADALDRDAPDPALAFVDAVRSRRRPPFSLHDAVGTLRLVERVTRRL